MSGTVVAIARAMQVHAALPETYSLISRTAVSTILGCGHAALSIARRDAPPVTVGMTDMLPAAVDELQYDCGQGPCLDVLAKHDISRTQDLATDDRWPAFTTKAVRQTGVRSMMCFRLFMQDDVIGSLNLYSRRIDAFDDYDLAIGVILAGHGSLALAAARHRAAVENLNRTTHTSRDIGIAMGVLMAKRGVTREQAITMLRNTSKHLDLQLGDVATWVARNGALPTS
jgi:GAF domain-containing protein